MFDNIVLGFLKEKSMTGYEIKKQMENSTSFFYNTSFGNIYPTLKKLEASGHTTCSQEIVKGKLNKTYTITPLGEEKFKEWLDSESDIGMIRDEALTKVFFFSHLDNEERKKHISNYIIKLEKQIDLLKNLTELYNERIDKWKIKTGELGIDYYVLMKQTYQKMLDEL